MIVLRDSSTAGYSHGAIRKFDEKSKKFSQVSPSAAKKPIISNMHDTPEAMSQIGNSCVGFSLVTNLLCSPKPGNPYELDSNFALRKVYFYAQKRDIYPGGEYPGANPVSGGTSILDGVKALKDKGLIFGYRWTFSNKQLKIGVGYNKPATIGIPWFEKMNYPNNNGYLIPRGILYAYHAITVVGYDKENNRFRVLNTWGPNWGDNGKAWIKGKHMKMLLANRGEAVFLKKSQ